MPPELARKHLYIADLAQRLQDLEAGRQPMHALTYRVLARQLREAAAGLPEPVLRQCLRPGASAGQAGGRAAASAALVDEMLQARHFDQHGWLPGAQAGWCHLEWLGLLARLLLPQR